MGIEWIADPTAWFGLATLVVLEIVLGIDNLVFIAILADKLPPDQRDRARMIGLSLALLMRLALLATISWIVMLTEPLFTVVGMGISGRDLILIGGGLFLLFKATMELHARLEGEHSSGQQKVAHAVFWQVIVQIVVLDAVFSLDSVITAVGMVDELMVMMIAVVIAIAVMMVASRPLMTFVSAHPTVVILCLGFLLMIGFSLIVEGVDVHVPKGYLYAAIAFSVMIESFNQIAQRNRNRLIGTMDMRDRAAAAVLRLLGGGSGGVASDGVRDADEPGTSNVFAPEERVMIHAVLSLAERPVRSVMTPRRDVVWLDIEESEADLRLQILETAHSRYPIVRGTLDELVGVALAKDLLRNLIETGTMDLERSARHPPVVHEGATALAVMEQLRGSPLQMAMVLDEYGSIEGIVTPTDILEAIAGEFPEVGKEAYQISRSDDGSWLVDGQTDVRRLSALLGVNLTDEYERYSTLAGYILHHLKTIPEPTERLDLDGLDIEIVTMHGNRIGSVRVSRKAEEPARI